MSQNFLRAAADLQPKFVINFNLRASLARQISQPLIVDEPVGLVVFSDSSAVYLAQVADPGAGMYKTLGTVKANTYIHGWSVSSGRLYVLDGVELAAWDLREGTKKEKLNLIKDPAEIQKATDALRDLQKAIQRVEWATLLEQAEDEWVRLVAQQSAAPPSSEERDRLDTLASDYFRMLRSLREVTGSAGGGAAARQLVKELRKALTDKRLAVRQWCFSQPTIRKHSMEEALYSVFMIQGDGTLHACDKSMTRTTSRKWVDNAELKLAVLDLSQTRLIGYIGDGKLRVVEAKSFDKENTWAPQTTPPAGSTHTLIAANKQFWWGTDSGVYACEADESGKLRPTLNSGQPWTTRQVGRLNSPDVPYTTRVNPNDLFDTINVQAWVKNRANPSAPLNDGIAALLMLSDAAGKYKTPAEGTTYIIHGPFERDAVSAASSWTHIKAHPSKPLVLLSDSRGASALCRYPAAASVSQLIPLWSVAPWLHSLTPYSALDFALLQGWPTPAVRPLSKPYPDMVARLRSAGPLKDLDDLDLALSNWTPSRRHFGDRDLRLALWYVLYDRPFPNVFLFHSQVDVVGKKALPVFYTSAQLISLRERFGPPGGTWDYWPTDVNEGNYNVYGHTFASAQIPVNFDPPWVWKGSSSLFHSTPPSWVDPWGYNAPGDFVPTQPSPTYLDPFCFDGQLRFPQRRVPFDTSFKGRRWAVFTDNDPGSLLAGTKAPELLHADPSQEPSALVVTADEDRQRTTFEVLPPKHLRITFDVASHTLRHETPEFGSTGKQVVAAPLVFQSLTQTFPVAWCVMNPEFPTTRLRKLATVSAPGGVSSWDKFVSDNKAQYGPKDGGKAWQIELCPLPGDALPLLSLYGYGLPASS